MCSSSGPHGCLATGAEISRPEFSAANWLIAPARSTVVAALIEDGHYPEIERSTNLRDLVDPADFAVPWWYRAEFVASREAHTTLCIDGVLHKADLFVNGHEVASAQQIAGAYAAAMFEVTDVLEAGVNAIALRVHPGNPIDDLTINWWDWNQPPPGHDLGVWRDVLVERTGPIRLEYPMVSSSFDGESPKTAALTISFDATNLSDAPAACECFITITGHGTRSFIRDSVQLEPGETRVVSFDPERHDELRVDHPALWWPIREGPQNRYELDVTALVDGEVSDHRSIRFGIRTVTSRIEPGGGRLFLVNGRETEVVGGGWSPDLFLRSDSDRVAAELAYVADLGQNAVRLEGKLENPEFFEMTDAHGILVLAGWECCSRWEEKGPQGTPWNDNDFRVARRSMESAARLLRHHPSVIAFLIGSDFAPPAPTAQMYVEVLRECRWDVAVVSAASSEPTDAAGPSGMKMTGPYSWVPPNYWYARDPERGGAVGFNSETSAGATIPRLTSLVRFLSEGDLEALWTDPDAKQFHAGPPSEFDNLAIFHRALAGRYGRPRSLSDFVRKAQLANYEASRAQFEAYRARAYATEPATGVIYWLLNSAWPSLNWQLYDWYLDPGGAYYGAKKGCEPVHPFYAYDDASIGVANHTRAPTGDLRLTVRVFAYDGQLIESSASAINSLGSRTLTTFERVIAPKLDVPMYFVSLDLSHPDGGRSISKNDYWLSSLPDVLDWDATTWQCTPTTKYADLSGLERLLPATLDAVIENVERDVDVCVVRVRVKNSSTIATPAIGLHVAITFEGDTGPPFIPVFWNDNDVSLFADDDFVFSGRCETRIRSGLGIEISGFNLEKPIRLSL